jgi:hypothetical protein
MQADTPSRWLFARVRWLDASNGLLCIRFSPEDAVQFALQDGRRAEVTIYTLADVYSFRGIIRHSEATPWLSPDSDGSHERFTSVLRDAGVADGDDIHATVSFGNFTV